MKRTTLVAALTGVALIFAGCSSTSGTATPAGSSNSSSPSTAASITTPEGTASSAITSTPESSAAGSLQTVSSPAGSGSESAESATSGLDSTAPDSTVGAASGGLDARSKVWFTAFCGGLAPAAAISGSLKSPGSSAPSSPTAAMKKLVVLFTAFGTSLTKTAATLDKLPPPTFAGGEAFAAKVVKAFGTAGPAISAAAKKIASDPSSLTSGMGGLSSSLAEAVAPVQELGTMKLTPATEKAIEALPACAKVKSLAGG